MSEKYRESYLSKQDQRVAELLQASRERTYRQNLSDKESDTLLRTLHKENDETHVHSHILFWLMTRPCRKDRTDSFLLLLLKELEIPPELLDDKWTPYRERYFGDGRIDFVLESPRFVICIEMKIGAPDGSRQLERYEGFCRSRGKEYLIFYLTPSGSEPSRQSVGKMDTGRLRRISFQKEILSWLEKCLTHTETGGYKYSYIKQYIGTIHSITDCKKDNATMNHMIKLITDTESAMAALALMDELRERITKVLNDFFFQLAGYLEKDTKYHFHVWREEADKYLYSKTNTYPGITAILDSIKPGRREYQMIFYVELGNYMYGGFVFHAIGKDGEVIVPVEEMKKKAPEFYRKWVEAIDKAKIGNIKHDTNSLWFPIENTNGEMFYFKEYSNSVLELIDDMGIQVEYIGDYLSKQVVGKVSKNANGRGSKSD